MSSMRRPLFLLVAPLLLIGCTGQVQVVDPAGKPVQGADVVAVALSISGPVGTTDTNGKATVPLNCGGQNTKWVAVSKEGFERVQEPVPAKWPLKVTLHPATRPWSSIPIEDGPGVIRVGGSRTEPD